MKIKFSLLKSLKFNYKLGKKTWFGTGGKCLVFFEPSNIKQLFFFLKIIPKNFPFFIFGLGSNILFRDGRFNGAVIKLGEDFKKIELNKKKKIIKSNVNKRRKDVVDVCTILEKCSIDEISKYLLKQGKKKKFPDITYRQ